MIVIGVDMAASPRLNIDPTTLVAESSSRR